jgi:hypothetical protein
MHFGDTHRGNKKYKSDQCRNSNGSLFSVNEDAANANSKKTKPVNVPNNGSQVFEQAVKLRKAVKEELDVEGQRPTAVDPQFGMV